MTTPSALLVDALNASLAAVDAAAIPPELRPIAFSKSFDFLTGANAVTPAGTSSPLDDGDGGGGGGADSTSDPVAKIAGKLGVGAELVSRVYDVDEEGVHLMVGRSALDDRKRFAMQEVARLIIAGRQALGLEEFTSSKTIRDACEDRGVLDSGNFAVALAGLDGKGVRLRGSGAGREGKMNAAGYEAAADDVKRLAGGA
jgi:hypothetical protein